MHSFVAIMEDQEPPEVSAKAHGSEVSCGGGHGFVTEFSKSHP